MKKLIAIAGIMISIGAGAQKTILINNVQIFNGVDEKIITGNVLIVGNLVTKISTTPIPTNKSANTTIIDGKGKFLMPGLIDAHVHTMMESIPAQLAMVSDIGYVNLFAGRADRKSTRLNSSHTIQSRMPSSA